MSPAPAPSDARPGHDVIVIGGGAAGLSAALYLGRARRRTLVLDGGRPRNAASPAAHGVFTRDGTPPAALLMDARGQLARYPTVELRSTEAVQVTGQTGDFAVRLADGTRARARRLLLACGVTDELPPIEGLAERWGTGVLHCAYCHGYEVADGPLAVYSRNGSALEAVAGVLPLTRDLLLCTDGPGRLSVSDRQRLARHGVRVQESGLVRVGGDTPRLTLHFADGTSATTRALFVSSTLHPGSRIPLELGCTMAAAAQVAVDSSWETSVPGVYAAGDLATAKKQVAVAAASGAEAAMSLHGQLCQEEFGGEWTAPLCAGPSAGRGSAARQGAPS